MGAENALALAEEKTEPDKPWASFPIQVHPSIQAFFSSAIKSEVGNGMNTLFWTDRWLHGQRLDHLVPNLFDAIPSRARKRTVHDALTDRGCVTDIRGALTLAVLSEFLRLWDLVSDFALQPEVTYGNFLLQADTRQNLPTNPCSLEPPFSDLGRGFGEAGPLANANSSCGW
jgi:hypothetical protein